MLHMGVSINGGTAKWMVYFMENPVKMDDLGVPPWLWTPPYGLETTDLDAHPRSELPIYGLPIVSVSRWPAPPMIMWATEKGSIM